MPINYFGWYARVRNFGMWCHDAKVNRKKAKKKVKNIENCDNYHTENILTPADLKSPHIAMTNASAESGLLPLLRCL